jgi:hypothetical protein
MLTGAGGTRQKSFSNPSSADVYPARRSASSFRLRLGSSSDRESQVRLKPDTTYDHLQLKSL